MSSDKIRALTLRQARNAIAAGDLSAVEATEAALEQAARFDSDYALFITLTPELALEQARAADAARAAGTVIGPLHGVPITVKDNIDTAGIATTAGARIFAERVPREDATVVARLKQAGAVIVGKTNLHEMAMGGTSNNPHYGAVRNPWNHACVAGGSSGGAAAAQALRIGYAALGTDSGGSVRIPAALCGVVGLKQTHGLVSLTGCVPTGTWSTDHIGPLTTSVDDAAIMLGVMQGYDPRDPDSVDRQPAPCTLDAGLRGVRVGVPENYFWEPIDSDVARLCGDVIAAMEQAGAEIVPVTLASLELLPLARVAMLAEAFLFHEPYLREHYDQYGADIRDRLLAGQYVLAHDYIRALRARRIVTDEISGLFARIDVLATPTVPVPAPPVGAESISANGTTVPVTGPNGAILVRNTMPANQAGVPAISLPAGCTASGLPVGFQLVADAFEDHKLLAIAGRVEQLISFTAAPPVLSLHAQETRA